MMDGWMEKKQGMIVSSRPCTGRAVCHKNVEMKHILWSIEMVGEIVHGKTAYTDKKKHIYEWSSDLLVEGKGECLRLFPSHTRAEMLAHPAEHGVKNISDFTHNRVKLSKNR
jgi:hypothetical protein